MATAEPEFIKTESWCEHVVTTIENILTKNESVSFTPEFKIKSHFFGNLDVLTCAGKSIQLREVIISLKYGRLTYTHQEFSQGN